jgi:PAS domain S-box-containing protein
MMEKVIRILHLEDNDSDSKLVQAKLKKADVKFDYFFADNEADYINTLNNKEIDLILSDYHLPDYSGSDALLFAKNNFPQIPFVFISGTMGEDVAIESLLNGATDYVLKNKIERLVPAVYRAFNEADVKKAQVKAEKELHKLSLAVEQSPNSVIITNMEGIIEYANQATLRLTGYSSHELIGKNPRIFSSGEKSEYEYKALWKTIGSGKEWKGEFHNRKKNGELYWESATISPIFDDIGNTIHYLAIKQDVTDSKLLNLELIAAKEKAEESDHLKTAFLHNITHEIRTPMNAIVGFSSLLKDPDLTQDQYDHFSDLIIQSSDQLLSIITDIVSIATIEAGQEKIAKNNCNINALGALINRQCSFKAKDKNIDLSFSSHLADDDANIITDETKLTQILNNLVYNGIKFTSRGHIKFGYTLNNKQLEFFVEDTGIGIPTEMHEEIFKRFRQVESTNTRKYGGSGLGLSISRAYVELLGGKLWVESALGKGSVFRFTLPFRQVSADVSQTKITASAPVFRNVNHKILLVAEDEDSNFVLLTYLLSGLNLTILRANNGAEAVEICHSNDIDLVLMDIKMPVMDGYEATKQILRFKTGLSVIAQTAYSTEADRNKAIACGCCDFISKPIKKDLLISLIFKHLKVNLPINNFNGNIST